jgi:hypothetical protein
MRLEVSLIAAHQDVPLCIASLSFLVNAIVPEALANA